MSPDRFDHLLETVKHKVEKQDTRYCKAIPGEERLDRTLRFLPIGDVQ